MRCPAHPKTQKQVTNILLKTLKHLHNSPTMFFFKSNNDLCLKLNLQKTNYAISKHLMSK